MDASHVYVGAWALGCFHSHNYYYPNLSEGADRVGGQLRRILVLKYNCGISLAPKHPRKHETHPPRVKKRERKEEESVATLQAPLSGIFLQTLPDLVTPLKGHSLSPRSCPPTRSAPSERYGYSDNYDRGSSLAPKHPRKHETHPPQVKRGKKRVTR